MKAKTKIYAVILLAAISASMIFGIKVARADGDPYTNPFYAGIIVAFTPPTLICPAFTTEVNTDGTFLNLFLIPGSQIEGFWDIYTPGNLVRGSLLPFPGQGLGYPLCPVPNLFPIFEIGSSS